MTQQSLALDEKILQHPRAAICKKCQKVATRTTIPQALLQATGLILLVPAIGVLFSVLFGVNFMHDNSLFLTVVFLGMLRAAWGSFWSAVARACPSCCAAPLVQLDTAEGQQLLSAKQQPAELK